MTPSGRGERAGEEGSDRPVAVRWIWVLAALLVVIPCARIASLEWFSRDDFAFLVHVERTDPWLWSDVFLPLERRFWPFYRPLGMESFFWLGFRLFGLGAFGYFATAIALHFAWYNFGRVHRTLRVTPAMEAGIADHAWSMREILEAA